MEPISKRNKSFQPSLQLTISSLFTLLILLVGAVLGWFHYQSFSKNLLVTAEKNFDQVSREMAQNFIKLVGPTIQIVEFNALSPLMEANNLAERLLYLPEFKVALEQVPSMTGLQAGYSNNDYFLVKLIRSPDDLTNLNAPPLTTLMAIHIADTQNSTRIKQTLFFDESFKQIGQTKVESSDYNTRERPWYKRALNNTSPVATDPYYFYFANTVGSTIVIQDPDSGTVIGADLTIKSLSEIIGNYKITPRSEVVLLEKSGNIIAYNDTTKLITRSGSDFKLAKLTDLGQPALTYVANNEKLDPHQFVARIDGELWRGEIIQTPIGHDIYTSLLIIAPENELLADAIKLRRHDIYIILLILAFFLPLAWVLAQKISKPLRKLALEAENIKNFDFSQSPRDKIFIKEVDDLAQSMGFMKTTIADFLNLIESLNKEKDFHDLLGKITSKTGEIAQADIAITYLLAYDESELKPVVIYQTKNTSANSTPQLPSLAITKPFGICRASNENKIDVSTLSSVEKKEFATLITTTDAQELTILTLPLQDRQGNSMGVVALLYVHVIGEQPKLSDNERVSFIKKASSFAGALLETKQLLRTQKDLFDAFIKLIAGAIDAKSPYTGGHCQRVPVITKMLAAAACKKTEGIFSAFDLNEDQWEELHVAAWLHDCGKVTTPDHVVDKATKLETIYDRIHEIRMRFEVLKRDAEIACWKEIADSGKKEFRLENLQKKLNQLDEDFAFIAKCNCGGEFMGSELIDRLHKIAEHSWLRTLDNRIGISWEEEQRMLRTPASSLPAREKLLADKEEHLIRHENISKDTDDNQWGFKVDEPEYRYNRGEIYNLQITKGTLSGEERFKINDHIIQTIKMLEQLPYPKHLHQIPEIAGGHHETMLGTGYPRKLTGDQMSTSAKIMVIADVFEALTASDRPYQKPRKLSESIKIMSFMHKDGHFDPDLFNLFLTSGVFKAYAEKFLAPEQIDDVDIEQYI